MKTFYLGTHQPNWLATARVPLFVSHRTLAVRKALPVASAPWALDSGGFTELSMHGGWRTSEAAYVAAARRYRDEIGQLDWAAPQDWMCEPFILSKTGLEVEDHQRRTIASVLSLRANAPDIPWIPVLQGWLLRDYFACAEKYEREGLNLKEEPVVGLGSVCRRQGTVVAWKLAKELGGKHGLRLHGFGVKTAGLRSYRQWLTSADSMAWSFAARRRPVRLSGHSHMNCANCMEWALDWRAQIIQHQEGY